MNPFSALVSLATLSSPQTYPITEVPTQDEALRFAQAWVAKDPQNRTYATVLPTGSMKQKFDENSFSLLQKITGTDKSLKKGDLVVYNNDDRFTKNPDGTSANVIHEVAALNKTHFIGNGTNNKHYDGWQPRQNIKYKAEIVKWVNKNSTTPQPK